MTERRAAEIGGRTIGVRVFALTGLGMLAPLVVMAWAGWLSLGELERRLIAERALIAEHGAERLGSVLSREMGALHELGSLVARQMAETERVGLGTALRAEHAHRHELFESLFVLGAGGEVVAREPDRGPRPDGARLWSTVQGAGRAIYSDLITDDSGTRRLYALVPLTNGAGVLQQVVGGSIDPAGARISALLRAPSMKQGSVDLIDSQGVVAASTQQQRAGLTTPHSRRLASIGAQKRSESGSCTDCAGPSAGSSRELYAFVPLATVHWGVSVRQSMEDAYAFAGMLSRNVAGVAALLMVGALLFAWGAALSVTRPLTVLTEAAERMTQGELATPIPRLPRDEVGRLGTALEAMRRALADSRRRIEGANLELEARVRERTAELERVNAVLKEREDDRTVLLRKVMSAQEDERKRIARELHDETSQSLAALAMGLETVASALTGAGRQKVDEATALTLRILAEVHRIMVDLRPSVLDDLGLQSAIAWYADRTLKPKGLVVRCEFSGLESRLPRDVEIVVFRTVQECLTNIARHAEAETVLVQCARREGMVNVEIEDDGKGFDRTSLARPSHSGRGLGLLGMRERVELFGGTVTLDSSPGQGTRVAVSIPLPSERGLEADHG